MHEKPGSVYQSLSFNMDNACTVMHTDKILMTTQGQKLLHMCTWDASSTHLFQNFEHGYSHAELTVYLSYRLINAVLTCIRTMHESQGVCSESIEVSWRSDLIPASCKRAWPICCNLVMKLVKCKLAKRCASVLLAQAHSTMFYVNTV